MKKLLAIASLATLLTACGGSSESAPSVEDLTADMQLFTETATQCAKDATNGDSIDTETCKNVNEAAQARAKAAAAEAMKAVQ